MYPERKHFTPCRILKVPFDVVARGISEAYQSTICSTRKVTATDVANKSPSKPTVLTYVNDRPASRLEVNACIRLEQGTIAQMQMCLTIHSTAEMDNVRNSSL